MVGLPATYSSSVYQILDRLLLADRVAGAFDRQHSRQRDRGPFARVLIYLDLVDDLSLDEIFQNPAQVRQVDAEHRRAQTLAIAEHDDLLLRVLILQTIDQMNFG